MQNDREQRLIKEAERLSEKNSGIYPWEILDHIISLETSDCGLFLVHHKEFNYLTLEFIFQVGNSYVWSRDASIDLEKLSKEEVAEKVFDGVRTRLHL